MKWHQVCSAAWVLLLTLGGGWSAAATDDTIKSAPSSSSASTTSAGAATNLMRQRWWCYAEGELSRVKFDGQSLAYLCIPLRRLIAELNAHGPWTWLYAGPDPSRYIIGVTPLANVDATSAQLQEYFHLIEVSRDPDRKEIRLAPGPDFPEARVVPLRAPDEGQPLPADLPVAPGGCRNLTQDGVTWIWCRQVSLSQALAAFNQHSAWQVEVIDPPRQNLCVSYLIPADPDRLTLTLESLDMEVVSRDETRRLINFRGGRPPSWAHMCNPPYGNHRRTS